MEQTFSTDVALVVAGVSAVALGFALKDLVASVLVGFVFLLGGRPFRVGDRVRVSGVHGDITGIGLWSVRLSSCDGQVVTIPNQKFLNEITASGPRGARTRPVQMDVYLASHQDLARAKRIVEDAVQHTRFASIEEPWEVHVSVLAKRAAVRLRARVHALDPSYEKALETDVTERVLEALAAQGIGLATPVSTP